MLQHENSRPDDWDMVMVGPFWVVSGYFSVAVPEGGISREGYRRRELQRLSVVLEYDTGSAAVLFDLSGQCTTRAKTGI